MPVGGIHVTSREEDDESATSEMYEDTLTATRQENTVIFTSYAELVS
jgi:hypothetical protein